MWSFLRRLFNRPLERPQAVRDFKVPDRLPGPAPVRIPVAQDPPAPSQDSGREEPAPKAAAELMPSAQELALRRLDVDVAARFLFFSSIELDPPRIVIPSGIPIKDDDRRSAQEAKGPPVTIPYYSSNPDHFMLVEGRVRDWQLDLYPRVLAAQGLDEARATLEKKCRAALAALARSISKDVGPCDCGKVVAWLPSPPGEPQPYEIKRYISTEPDGSQTVIVSTQDVHYCERCSHLSEFLQKAIHLRSAKELQIRLATAEPFVLSWSRGKDEVEVFDDNRRLYGSINLKTRRYRLRRRSKSLKDLLDEIDLDPADFDWTFGEPQTRCCFCGRPLSNDISVKWGYGPTCAENYGLPWGDRL